MNSPSNSESQNSDVCRLDITTWYRKVYACCRAKLISQADAEDATQETFTRGFAKIDDLRSESAIGGWLRGIAHNVCVDTIRRNKVRQTAAKPIDDMAIAASPEEKLPTEDLEAAIGRLPEPLREVILLHYYNDMTYDQMAEWLNIARSTVSERLSQARAKLRSSMVLDGRAP